MKWNPFGSRDDAREVLAILDKAAADFTFPAFDNGYIYPALARLSVFRDPIRGRLREWALVFEAFCYSPRDGHPGIYITTFASTLHNRDSAEGYRTSTAHNNYLKKHPHDDFRTFKSLDIHHALDPDNQERIAADLDEVFCRGESVSIPSVEEFARLGIDLESPPRIWVFELCRYLAETRPAQVLATPEERRVSVLPEMAEVLQIDDWRHPDIVSGQKPSEVETFRQLAKVLATGEVERYHPTELPNTHWKNWPEGGSL